MANLIPKEKSLLVPPLSHDESLRALATLIARIEDIDLSPLLVYYVDHTEKTALHHLAEQFHIMGNEGWTFAKTEEQKRALIKNAIQLHRHKGTPWAVKEAISQFGFFALIQDWFMYGGDPYYFRVDIELKNQIWDQEISDTVYGLIGQWKNTRSHLDKMRVFQTVKGDLKIASACIDGEIITVRPHITTGLESVVKTSFMFGAICMGETITVYPLASNDIELTKAVTYGGAVQSLEITTLCH